MGRLAVIAGAFVLASSPAAAYVDWSLVKEVNNKQGNSWVAGYNPNFEAYDLKRVQGLVGCSRRKTEQRQVVEGDTSAIPEAFDSRQKWSACKSMSQIRNQAECGSCWAFGAVEAFTDRYCVTAQGRENPIMSAMKLVTCDTIAGVQGCNGGGPHSAWDYIRDDGLPTTECQPYTLPTCKPDKQPCMPPFQPTPPCKKGCNGPSSNDTKYHVSNVYTPGDSAGAPLSLANTQMDLMTKGPIEACFNVYADFIHYKSGVYRHTSGKLLGGHCVKVIGWGQTSNGTKYWEVANSWTTTWGDKGYFKILRGVNECGFESDMVAGDPILHP